MGWWGGLEYTNGEQEVPIAEKTTKSKPEPGFDAFAPPLDPRMNEDEVRERFWPKLKRVIARVPFVDDLVAAYYCALDPATPGHVKAVLIATVGYFILPTDLIPDFILALGFTDDATVLATALGMVGAYIKDRHRSKARKALGLKPREDADGARQPDDPGDDGGEIIDVTPTRR